MGDVGVELRGELSVGLGGELAVGLVGAELRGELWLEPRDGLREADAASTVAM